MKIKYMRLGSLAVVAGGWMLVSGCVVEPDGRVGFQPVVVEAPRPVVYAPAPVVYAPAPVVVEAPEPAVMVPDSYTYDGTEYVGVVGDQYFYLGAGNVWLVCDPIRLGRFHGWERYHSDWRVHAIRNDRFRNDAHGHFQARHDNGHSAPRGKPDEHGHDHDHDHGH